MNKEFQQFRAVHGDTGPLASVIKSHEDRLRAIEGKVSIDEQEADLAKQPDNRKYDEHGRPRRATVTPPVDPGQTTT